MNTSEKFCLKWNEFQNNISTTFGSLREDTDFADVTLVSDEGKQVEAHKLILAASSPFFQNLLKRNKHAHPLIYMRGMKSEDILAILDFLYYGEANIYQENLDKFLAVAEELELKGLSGNSEDLKTDNMALEPYFREKAEQRTTIEAKQDNLEHRLIIPEHESGRIFSGTIIPMDGSGGPKKEEFSGDLKDLDDKVRTMYSLIKIDGHGYYTCHVCGKQVPRNNPTTIKNHIEANHIEGISLPCNLCDKTFRYRAALRMHYSKSHMQ